MSSSADADGFLDELDALNLTSPSATATNGIGVGGGTRSAATGQVQQQDLSFFGFGTAGHHHHQHHIQHPQDMDLANFNSVFSSSDGSNNNKLDGGGGDDNSSSAQHSGQQNSSSSSNANASAASVNFDALQQLLSLQMQMQSPLAGNNMPMNMNSNPFAGLSMPLSTPMSMSMSVSGSVDGSGSTPSSGQSGQGHSTAAGANQQQQAAVLLEQQLRLQQLQQLQQLQNHIFQQQIELISGQASLSSSLEATPLQTPAFRDSNQFQGLPTPANSTELRPQPPPNFVSPMTLQNYLAQPGAGPSVSSASATTAQFGSNNNPHSLPQAPSSAPAHLAFSTHAPLLSPDDLNFELSPITSPWLGAASYQQAQQQLQQHQHQLQPQSQPQVPTHTHTHRQTQSQSQSQSQPRIGAKRRASKRGASSSGDDADGLGDGHAYASQARKRQSPAIRATIGGGVGSSSTTTATATNTASSLSAAASTSTRKTPSARRAGSGSVSVGSTPALRAQQHQFQSHQPQPQQQSLQQQLQQDLQQQGQEATRSGSTSASAIAEIVGDTPSPVDLSMSMPPPAPPMTESESSSGSVGSQQSGAIPSSALSPVTPASIMNLGRLGLSSGLSSPLARAEDQQHQQQQQASANAEKTTKGKGKSKTPPKSSSNSTTTSSSSQTQTQTKSLSNKKASTPSSTNTPLISPSLKPLLPGGLAPSSAAHLGSASNYTHHLSGSAAALHITPSTSLPPPAPTIRKTSHKAAEQKRRDSLKTSFDQLRLLLPPLPLPNEEGYHQAYGGEAPPPGSMPPRGPPRGDVQGPNRAVSKLTLLRCGNEYIRLLKGRVERRDVYIEALRREVRALRTRAGKESVDGEVRMHVDADANGEGDASGREGGNVEEGRERELSDMTDEFEKVDLEKDIDAMEMEEGAAPLLGFGTVPADGRDEDDED